MTELTQAEFARYRKVSRKTVSTWKSRGLLVLSATGSVDVSASDKRIDGRPVEHRGGVTTRLKSVTPAAPGNSKERSGNNADPGQVTSEDWQTAEEAVYLLLWQLRHAATCAAIQSGASAQTAFSAGWILYEIGLDFGAEALHRAGVAGYDCDEHGSLNPGQIAMTAKLDGGREPVWDGMLPGAPIEIETWKSHRDALPWWREFVKS